MTKAEEIKVKLASVLALLLIVITGTASLIAMRSTGINEAYERSKEYTNVRMSPIEKDVDDLKKKIDSFQFK